MSGRLLFALLAAAFLAGCRGPGVQENFPAFSIRILYDAFSDRDLDPDHTSGDPALDWGFSALVDFSGRTILFDGGNDLQVFRRNVRALGADLRRVDLAVLSHNHNDHTAGIAHLLEVNPRVKLYVPADPWLGRRPEEGTGLPVPREKSGDPDWRYWRGGASRARGWGARWPQADWEPVGEALAVEPGIHLIPTAAERWGYFDIAPDGKRADRPLPELTLVLRTWEGLVLITGCSHSGIARIAEAARAALQGEPILLIAGGFHLVDQEEAVIRALARDLRERLGVRQVAPGHCTGEIAFRVFREVFGEDCLYAGLGAALSLLNAGDPAAEKVE